MESTFKFLSQKKYLYPSLILLSLLFFLPGLVNLPPTDRDESRFAQASKQMIETENYIDIRFQDVPRYKKPIGIYWLQSACVKAFNQPLNSIWPYRIPSLIGAMIAVLLTGFLGNRLFSPQIGLLSGILLASCLLLGVEARLAKTDAMLLATIVLMQSALCLLYLERHEQPKGNWKYSLLFWGACGTGILIKGPVPPLLALFTICALALYDQEFKLFKVIRPLPGLILMTSIVLPWIIAIQNASGGEFLEKAVMGDFLPKLLSGQESHGAPPGYYFLLFPLFFWPGSLLAIRAIPSLWASRSNDKVRFLFAWIIPTWMIFELVPTKLPHYVLPFFPAIAILTAYGVVQTTNSNLLSGRYKTVGIGLLALGSTIWGATSLILTFGIPTLSAMFGRFHALHIVPICSGLLILTVALKVFKGLQRTSAVPLFTIGALMIYSVTFSHILPRVDIAWPSRHINETLATHPPGNLISVGFNEPSLPFLVGTKSKLTHIKNVETLLKNPEYSYLLLESRQEEKYPDITRNLRKKGKLIDSFESYNYSKGDTLNFELYAMP